MVIDQLNEAVGTLKALRCGKLKPSQRMTSWPPIVLQSWEAFAQAREHGYRPGAPAPVVPSPDAIDRADRAFAWLVALDRRAAAIVWLRACGFTWVMIGARFNITQQWARRLYLDALAAIVGRLNSPAKNSTFASCETSVSNPTMMG